MVHRQAVAVGGHERLHQPVGGGQLADGLPGHPGSLVLQEGVLEPGKDALNIGVVGFGVEAELLDEALAALPHSLVDQRADGGVSDALHDGLMPPEGAQIGADGVAAVQGEQLALQIGVQVVHPAQALDLGPLALPAAFLHVPLGILLYRYVQGVLKAGLGDDAVHGAVGKAHILLGVSEFLLAQVAVDGVPQLAGAPDCVLAGHHVEDLGAPGGLPGLDAGGDGLGHDGQDSQAHGSGDQLAVSGDGLRQLRPGGGDAADVGDGPLRARSWMWTV